MIGSRQLGIHVLEAVQPGLALKIYDGGPFWLMGLSLLVQMELVWNWDGSRRDGAFSKGIAEGGSKRGARGGRRGFPHNGKQFRGFFHTMEPCFGKFSTQWKHVSAHCHPIGFRNGGTGREKPSKFGVV